MACIYTLVNQKGGVGKTTTAINLGAYLAHFGQRVLVVDLDPQANATSCLGVDKTTVSGGTYEALLGGGATASILLNERLKLALLPSSPALAGAEVELVDELAREIRLKKALEPLEDRYDYILIDCPPSLGLLTINGLVAAKDGVLGPGAMRIPCAGRARHADADHPACSCRLLFPELKVRGVILTMFDSRTNLSSDVVTEVNRHFPGQVFKAIVPRSVRLAEAPSYGLPILSYAPPPTARRPMKNLPGSC